MVSKRLEAIKDIDPDSSMTLRQIDEIFGEDGAPVTILFLCLPFLFPMPIPGISTAFGLAIILLTIRIASPRPLPLPKFTDRITLSGKMMAQIAEVGHKHILRVEKHLKPRASYLTQGTSKILAAIAMILASVALALPIPPVIPLTNTIPAVAISLFALGILMRDGVMIVLGHIFHIASWVYFASIAGVAFAFAQEAIDLVQSWLSSN
jgi:hypothetical protein